jgi:hypothetical protein
MPEKSAALEAMDRDAKAFAAGVANSKKRFRRRRSYAAFLVGRAINAPYSERQLRAARIHYIIVGRDALYADEDLQALAERILADAKVRGAEMKRVSDNAA